MRALLTCTLMLAASACAGPRLSGPEMYPAVPLEASVVRSADAAIEAVRTHVIAVSDTSLYDLAGATASEGPGEWWVEAPYARLSLPSGTGFRVSKATGAVDVPFPRR